MTGQQSLAAIAVVALVVLAGCAGVLGGDSAGTATDTTASTPEPTATAQSGGSPTPDAKASPTPKPTPTPEESDTPDATPTPEPTPTPTPESTPTSTPTATPTPTQETVVVQGGELDIDATKVYRQLQEMLGTSAEPPKVYVRDEMPLLSRYEDRLRSPFRSTFGYGSDYINTSIYHGACCKNGGVIVMPKNATAAEQETLLAHEYVHWLQQQTDLLNTRPYYRVLDNRDSRKVVRGVIEGGSVYIVDNYVEEYMNVSWNQTQVLGNQYERGPTGRRIFRAPYYFGAKYLHATIDDASNLSWVYRPGTPTPETTEQLIHTLQPSEEPELNLTVSVTDSSSWDTYGRRTVQTRGELSLRTMLRIEHNSSVSASAAAGWGSDGLVQFEAADNASRHGYAWVTRWDTPADADEFRSAFDTWIQQQNPENSATFRQVRLGPETVVIFAGHPSFVRNASAAGGGSSVTVTPPDGS